MSERRVKQCEISFEAFSELIKQERYACNLPNDTFIVIHAIDHFRNTCTVFLYSEKFDVIEEGQEPPQIVVEYRHYLPTSI